jgi:hypothetical protein
MELKFTKNSDKFRQAAITFNEVGSYCTAPSGTTEFETFWDTEEDRCLNGYMAEDGDWISGYFYFYLNYCRILLVNKKIVIRKGKEIEVEIRSEDFPRFWDSDRAYYDAIELAEIEGRHLVVLKARGRGYSWKGGSMLVRNLALIPKSKSYAVASEMEFLTKDGLLTKAWDILSFINQNTAWSKRMSKIDTKTHKRASFIDDYDDTEKGFKSEIIGVTLKNDPQKARGKRGKLILFEEAGKFPGLLESWQIARPSVEQGSFATGLMIAFGTGGTQDANYESLKELFYSPLAYNVLPFENIYDHGAIKPCGFFVPEYVNMEGVNSKGESFMDKDGNSNIQLAIEEAKKERQLVLENANDKNAVDRYIAEHPFTPMDACLQIAGNIFPKQLLMDQLVYLQTNRSAKNAGQCGRLEWISGGLLEWKTGEGLKAIEKFPLDRADKTTGAIQIWEHPYKDEAGKVPPFLYIAATDPYDQDRSESGSLGSTLIYKRFQNFEENYDFIVAEYTARPPTANEYYENVRKLLTYYNAINLYENEKMGIYQYFVTKQCTHLLADQPEIIHEIIKDSHVRRNKGIHMVTKIKDYGEGKLKDWLNEEYAPGMHNVRKLYSIPLIKELIGYYEDGNFDRVIAFLLLMIYNKELHSSHVRLKNKSTKEEGFFPDVIFTNKVNFID